MRLRDNAQARLATRALPVLDDLSALAEPPAPDRQGRGIEVSFVIPAHNEQALLPRTLAAIKSEIARVGCGAEIIVVDNASTDDTAVIAGAVPGVTVVPEPRKGLSQARQSGFLASTGRLVANIDADTILPQGWLAKVLREFERDPELVALSGPYIYYDAPMRVRTFARIFYTIGWCTYACNRFVLRVGSMLQGGNFVVTRAALNQIGGFDPAFTFYGEDTDAARRLHRVGGVKFTFGLPAFSSGRRLAGDGLWATGMRYSVNYLWATFKHKPYTQTSRDYRDQNV